MRFFVFCAAYILFGTSVLPALFQDSKPGDGPNKKIARAGMEGVGTPVCIYCPPPGYSKKARADKLQGVVVLDITVTTEGKAKSIILVKGLGEGLDEQAEKAIKSWRLALRRTAPEFLWTLAFK
jgi:TonB family protein